MPSACFRAICKQMAKLHEAIVDILPQEQVKVGEHTDHFVIRMYMYMLYMVVQSLTSLSIIFQFYQGISWVRHYKLFLMRLFTIIMFLTN